MSAAPGSGGGMERGPGSGVSGPPGAFRQAAAAPPGRPKSSNGKAPREKSGEKIPAPFSLRLTAEERAALEAEAGDAPLGAFIRDKLLKGGQAPRRRRRRVGSG